MNLFADTLLDLRYEQGIVSFRLRSATSAADGLTLHLPIADAAQITALLHAEMPKIAAVHANWIAEQGAVPPPQVDTMPTISDRPVLGRKLASV